MRPLSVSVAFAIGVTACGAPGVVTDTDGRTDEGADTDRPVDTDAVDDTGPAPGQPRFNELECRGDEWVELVAVGGDVDLSGYRITNTPSVPDSGVVLPAGTALTDGALLAVGDLDFGIDCDGATVTLLDPSGLVIDAVTHAGLLLGQGFGRLPDAVGPWTTTAPTRAEPNTPWVRLDDSRLFDPYQPFEVVLTLPQDSVDALAEDPREYTFGHGLITAHDGTVLFDQDLGVRIKGQYGSARTLDGKAALKLDLDRYTPGSSALGVHKLTLNNMVQDGSKVHEWLAYTLFRSQGVPAPRTGYAHVTLNGADMGLYLNIETLDDVLIPRTYPSTQHLYEGAYGQDLQLDDIDGYQVDMGSDDDRADLEDIVAILDGATPSAEWAAVEPFLDRDQVITTLAVETWIGHWDGYGPTRNNYSFHLDDQGVLSLMSSGADQTFGSSLDVYSGTGRLLVACLADAACWLDYTHALDDLMTTIDGLDLEADLRALSAFLRPMLVADPRRESSVEDFDDGLQATIDFLYARRPAVGEAVACELDASGDLDGDGAWCRRDCDEGDPAIHPGAVDVCGDRIDQDCTGWADDDPTCPDCRPMRVGTHRYLACSTPRSWASARAQCQSLGSDLMIPNTPAELRTAVALQDLARDQEAWLGVEDQAVEGAWTGVDGAPITWTSWADGQPNNSGGQDCALLTTTGQWNDQPCDKRTAALCEDACLPGQDNDGDGHLRCGDDCNDDDANTYPGAPELCGDGVDQDCDGHVDGPPNCPDCVRHTIGGAGTYAVCPFARTWAEGRAECQSMGMDLASIDSTFENTKVWDYAQTVAATSYWIGRNDQASEGRFVDADGTTANFKAWSAGEPNDWGGNEDCAHFWSGSASWNDQDCASAMGTICELP